MQLLIVALTVALSANNGEPAPVNTSCEPLDGYAWGLGMGSVFLYHDRAILEDLGVSEATAPTFSEQREAIIMDLFINYLAMRRATNVEELAAHRLTAETNLESYVDHWTIIIDASLKIHISDSASRSRKASELAQLYLALSKEMLLYWEDYLRKRCFGVTGPIDLTRFKYMDVLFRAEE